MNARELDFLSKFKKAGMQEAKVSTTIVDEEEFIIDPNIWIPIFSSKLVDKLAYKNKYLSESLKLTEDEVVKLSLFAIKTRIDYCNGKKVSRAQMNQLFIPVWIEAVISKIGIIELQDYGLKLIPVCDVDVISYEEAVKISSRLKQTRVDLAITDSWLDSSRLGDVEVMSMVIIDDLVKGMTPNSGKYAFLTSFLHATIRNDSLLKTLFRVSYGSAKQFDTQFELYLDEVI